MLKIWTDNIDPATIPDEVLRSERARRNNALIANRSGGRNGGRPRKQQIAAAKPEPAAKATTRRAGRSAGA